MCGLADGIFGQDGRSEWWFGDVAPLGRWLSQEGTGRICARLWGEDLPELILPDPERNHSLKPREGPLQKSPDL